MMDQKTPIPVGGADLVFASKAEMKAAGEQVGKCGCTLTRVEGGLKMVDCALHANAQQALKYLKAMIERFEEKSGERPHVFCGCTYCHAVKTVADSEGRTLPPIMTADPKARYNVTRWCCTSGDCIGCHGRRDSGEAPNSFPHEAARIRIIQGKDLTAEQAEKHFNGWNQNHYEPKIERA
jgi:cytochrome c553